MAFNPGHYVPIEAQPNVQHILPDNRVQTLSTSATVDGLHQECRHEILNPSRRTTTPAGNFIKVCKMTNT
jgi:hypothetical protein